MNNILQAASQPRYNSAMSRTATQILEEARLLPPSEREWVAHGLLIDEIEDIDPEWAAEIERRVADADSPNAVTGSWDELEARLRGRLSQ
ncbi:addiction module protein [Terracidiphilus sp.]|jgi:hypothetical protein|uniref:addiction module protein n=1 Tax=Terracidiphilus sp. TaxID=1964191 RepID=UPI003C17D440